jgi:hypothetical protein
LTDQHERGLKPTLFCSSFGTTKSRALLQDLPKKAAIFMNFRGWASLNGTAANRFAAANSRPGEQGVFRRPLGSAI